MKSIIAKIIMGVVKLIELDLFQRIANKYWLYINPLKFRNKGVRMGRNAILRNRIYLVMRGHCSMEMGDRVVISSGDGINPLCRNICAEIFVDDGAKLSIGSETGLSSPTIWCQHEVTIGSHVLIGGDVIIIDTDAHSLDYHDRRNEWVPNSGALKKAKCAPIHIGNDVLIGTRAIILKGVTIGDRSIIAAGAVVCSNVPEDELWGGNPAKFIKKLV